MNNTICRICGQSFERQNHLTHHISSTHKEDVPKYIGENFDDFVQFGWKRCVECKTPFRGRTDKCGPCFSKTHNVKTDQYIRCSICGKLVHSKAVPVHLKSHHGVEFLDYVSQHLDDFRKFGWTNCSVCGKVTKPTGKREATCSRECSNVVRKTWIGEKAARFGAVLSDDIKSKIGKSNSKPNPKIAGNANPACRSEVRAKISKTRIEKGVAKGENNPMFGKTHTPEAIKKIMTHRPMNRLEKKVADELDRLGIGYTFQFFIHDGSVCKSYDFKIADSPIILEVDGDFWHGNPNTKYHHVEAESTHQNDVLKEKMAAERGYTVIRLWEADIKKDITIVAECLKGRTISYL